MTPKQNQHERVCFILNPRSGGGRTGGREAALRKEVSRWFARGEVWTTQAAGHGAELARRAVDEGFDVVAAVGGDGTAHEVVNGLVEGGVARRPGVVFAVIPAGTGSDLVRTLRMPSRLEEAVATVAHGRTLQVDLISATVTGLAGPRSATCVNVAGFGVNGEVVSRVNQSSKRLGGTITFAAATARTLASYRAPDVHLSWTDTRGEAGSWSGPIFAVFLANGAYCGGGMWLGRGGAMNDGAMDLTIIPELGWARVLAGAPRLFTGTIAEVPGVLRVAARSLRATSSDDVRVDLDGEQPGALDASFELVPKVLAIRAVWADPQRA